MVMGLVHNHDLVPHALANDEVWIDGEPGVADFEIWKGARPDQPVTMYYDPLGETWPVTDAVIEAGLVEWNSVSPGMRYIYGGRLRPGAGQTNTCTSSPPNGTNTISWANLTGGTLARACIWSTSPECDIQMDSTDHPVLTSPEAFRTVLLHEAGHCAGLAHTNVRDAVMYPSYFAPKHLHPDDVAGICQLYGCSRPAPTPSDTVVVTPSATPTATPTPTPTPKPKLKAYAPGLARD